MWMDRHVCWSQSDLPNTGAARANAGSPIVTCYAYKASQLCPYCLLTYIHNKRKDEVFSHSHIGFFLHLHKRTMPCITSNVYFECRCRQIYESWVWSLTLYTHFEGYRLHQICSPLFLNDFHLHPFLCQQKINVIKIPSNNASRRWSQFCSHNTFIFSNRSVTKKYSLGY